MYRLFSWVRGSAGEDTESEGDVDETDNKIIDDYEEADDIYDGSTSGGEDVYKIMLY